MKQDVHVGAGRPQGTRSAELTFLALSTQRFRTVLPKEAAPAIKSQMRLLGCFPSDARQATAAHRTCPMTI
jgi:hypothetical protein